MTCNKRAFCHPKEKFYHCEKPGRQNDSSARGDKKSGVKHNDEMGPGSHLDGDLVHEGMEQHVGM